ncbi:unnamed protein product, partial [Polarella glacialis]
MRPEQPTPTSCPALLSGPLLTRPPSPTRSPQPPLPPSPRTRSQQTQQSEMFDQRWQQFYESLPTVGSVPTVRPGRASSGKAIYRSTASNQ